MAKTKTSKTKTLPVVTTETEVTTLPDTSPVTTFDLDAAVRALHNAAGVTLAADFRVPASYAALVDTIRAVMPDASAATNRDRAFYERVTRAVHTRMRELLPDAPEPEKVNTTHFLGLGIQDAQDVAYHALAVSGVFVSADLVACLWRALAPKAKCDFLGTGIAKGYPTTTLSAYMRGDHGTNPWFPGAVEALRPWFVAGGVTSAPKAK